MTWKLVPDHFKGWGFQISMWKGQILTAYPFNFILKKKIEKKIMKITWKSKMSLKISAQKIFFWIFLWNKENAMN